MPMRKFAQVASEVTAMGIPVREPEPVHEDDLLRVHSRQYVQAVRTGKPRELAESQKFPWSPELFRSVCLTAGGVIAASREALKSGIGAAIASGFHHAGPNRGEGFCTFNGLVVAAEHLRGLGAVQSVAVLDLDLHYGNGTASLVSTRPWMRALSIYGSDYADNHAYKDVSILRHADGLNHRSVPLPPCCTRTQLLATLQAQLPWLISNGCPDLLLFQAGADPFREDPYSPLSLEIDDLRERDRMVFRFAWEHGIPTAWVLAGGYTTDLSKVVTIHVNTFRAAREIYGI